MTPEQMYELLEFGILVLGGTGGLSLLAGYLGRVLLSTVVTKDEQRSQAALDSMLQRQELEFNAAEGRRRQQFEFQLAQHQRSWAAEIEALRMELSEEGELRRAAFQRQRAAAEELGFAAHNIVHALNKALNESGSVSGLPGGSLAGEVTSRAALEKVEEARREFEIALKKADLVLPDEPLKAAWEIQFDVGTISAMISNRVTHEGWKEYREKTRVSHDALRAALKAMLAAPEWKRSQADSTDVAANDPTATE